MQKPSNPVGGVKFKPFDYYGVETYFFNVALVQFVPSNIQTSVAQVGY
jgi:hypothetical protein